MTQIKWLTPANATLYSLARGSQIPKRMEIKRISTSGQRTLSKMRSEGLKAATKNTFLRFNDFAPIN